jgi:hypothetical protein
LTIDSAIPDGTKINIYGSQELQGVEGNEGSANFTATDEYGQPLVSPN